MPCPPLRFLHAANVLLDVPVWVPGIRSDRLQPVKRPAEAGHYEHPCEVAAVATRMAFRNIVQECLDRDVDFLLLCGDTFVEADRSLAARVALRDGLERLDAAGVPVFVLPGTHDPIDAWRAIPDLPESVTVFDDSDDPVEVTRDGAVIAIVGPDSRDVVRNSCRTNGEPYDINFARQPHNPIRIGLRYVSETEHPPSQLDYLALGGAMPTVEWQLPAGIVHHPGAPQPLSPQEPNGSCTLVEVDESRAFELTPLPTAPIRFEHLKKTIDEGDTADNLLQTLPGQLALRPAVDGEQVRCVVWTVDVADAAGIGSESGSFRHGGGPLWAALQSPDSRRELERALRRDADDGVPAVVHHMELARSTGDAAPADGLVADFEQAFAETWRKLPASDPAEAEPKLAASATLDGIARRLDEVASQRPEWKPRLDRLASRLSASAVVASARHAGRQRLECHTP